MLEFKKAEAGKSLAKYWEECQAAYDKTLREAEVANKQYDDYARIIERLADKSIGLDYLDKHITRKTVDFESFQFKVVNLDAV